MKNDEIRKSNTEGSAIKPPIICTIGSSRFCDIEAVMKWEFEKRGWICVGMHLLPQWYVEAKKWTQPHHGAEEENVASIMDELHLKKIEMSDMVFVINKNGYIGERTRFELNYAIKLGKHIEYLEPINPCVNASICGVDGACYRKISGSDFCTQPSDGGIIFSNLITELNLES